MFYGRITKFVEPLYVRKSRKKCLIWKSSEFIRKNKYFCWIRGFKPNICREVGPRIHCCFIAMSIYIVIELYFQTSCINIASGVLARPQWNGRAVVRRQATGRIISPPLLVIQSIPHFYIIHFQFLISSLIIISNTFKFFFISSIQHQQFLLNLDRSNLTNHLLTRATLDIYFKSEGNCFFEEQFFKSV